MQALRETFEKILAYYQQVDPGIRQVTLAEEVQNYLLENSELIVDDETWQSYLTKWEQFFNELYPQLKSSWQQIFASFATVSPQQLWKAHDLAQNEAWIWNVLFHPVLRQQSELLVQEINKVKESPYCPICGQPPLLALADQETNGRQLVCGKCTTKWEFTPLCCPQCNNTDHQTLVYRQVAELPSWSVDVCKACGYKLRSKALHPGSEERHPWLLDTESIFLNFI